MGAAAAPIALVAALFTAVPTASAGADTGTGVAGPPREEPQQQQQQQLVLVPDLAVSLQQNTEMMHKLLNQMGHMQESIGACEPAPLLRLSFCVGIGVVCVHLRVLLKGVRGSSA